MFTRVRNLFAAAETLPQEMPPVSPWQDDDVLAKITLADALGFSNQPVARSQAISLGPISRGRQLITGQISDFPLIVYRGSKRLTPQPAITSQLEQGRPLSVTIAWVVDALLFYGRAYLEITRRNWEGRPATFAFIPEWRAKTDGAGNLLAIDGRKVTADQWIRIDAPTEGLLTRAQEDINQALAIKLAVGRAADNPVPSIELHQTSGEQLTDAEISTLVGRWAAARRGENGGVAYTNRAIEVKTHGQSAEQLLEDARNRSSIDLANHLNLPAWAVDATVGGSSLSYSNTPSRSRELVDYTLKPFMNAIAGRLSMDDVLAGGVWCKFDTTEVLQGNFSERMDGYKTAIDAGIYTAEECRDLERGVPLEDRNN